ncbi:MAG: VTT domain-containing protein [Vicinamibacterales bacterium]
MPFGADALVIYLIARDGGLFWLYPLLAAVVSVAAAAVTFWIGRRVGDVGLPRLVPKHRVDRLRARVQKSGAVALAVPALLPPPFPLTPFVLTCGALNVNPWWFFPAFGLMRLVRFSVGAALALVYGPGILRTLESDTFQFAIAGVATVVVLGIAVSAVVLWRWRRPRALKAA